MVLTKIPGDSTWAPWVNDSSNIYILESEFDERHIPKEAKFRWHGYKYRKWWTDSIDVASKLAEYADHTCREELLSIKYQREQSFELSKKASIDREFKAPDGLKYFPFQNAGIQYMLNRTNTLLADNMGLGKLQDVESIVVTPNGYTQIGKLNIGDYVIGLDGKQTKVIGVYPQGWQDIYEVKFSDGVVVRCGLEHLWKVRDNNWKRNKRINGGDGWKVLSLAEMLQYKLINYIGGGTFWIPRQSATEHTKKDLPFDSYFIGVLIGDGSYCGVSLTLVLNDYDYYDIKKHIPDYMSIRQKTGCKEIKYPLSMLRQINSIGLIEKSPDKSIPEIYMVGSIEQRKDLFMGLMDTDGSCHKNRTIFHTRSNKLAIQVKQLVDSLGGYATIREYLRSDQRGLDIQVRIEVDFCPFKVRRKVKEWKPKHKNRISKRSIISIEKAGKAECVCIAVDSPDRLYLTGTGYVPTHNTLQVVGYINEMKSIERVLVVCPNTIKINWKRELNKWLMRKLSVEIANSQYFPDPTMYNIIIANYETVSKFCFKPTTKEINQAKGKDQKLLKKYEYEIEAIQSRIDNDVIKEKIAENKMKIEKLLDKITKDEYDNNNYQEIIAKFPWDLIVVDECHYIKSSKIKRSKSIYRMQAKHKLFLTGTPIVNRPFEIFTFLKYLDPGSWKDKEYYFMKRYCNGSWKGSNVELLPELQKKLRETIMIRRLKQDVLKELPAKIRQVIEIEADDLKQLLKEERELYEQGESKREELQIKLELAKVKDNEEEYRNVVKQLKDVISAQFSELARIRSETAVKKIPYIISHLESVLESENKVVFFCHHHTIIDEVMKHFKEKAVKIDGRITDIDKRQEAIDSFQNNADIKLFVGSIQASGVGITLTASNTVIFGELDWVPGNMLQAEDRCHRISQEKCVLVQLLVLSESIDVKMAHTIIRKAEIIEAALDNNIELEIENEIVDDGEHVRSDKKQIDKLAPYVSNYIKEYVLEGLKILSSICDGARQDDMSGFNRIDTRIGKYLASLNNLTNKQTLLGMKLCYKYRRQLPKRLNDIIYAEIERIKEANSINN